MPTVATFAVRETDVSRHNGDPSGAPIKREMSVSRTANVGTWLRKRNGGKKWVKQGPQLVLHYVERRDSFRTADNIKIPALSQKIFSKSCVLREIKLALKKEIELKKNEGSTETRDKKFQHCFINICQKTNGIIIREFFSYQNSREKAYVIILCSARD